MLEFTAYFDDSGTHAGSDAVAVAGYVSLDDRWASFQSEWQRALDDYGLPFFHMTDFVNGAQAYAHWPEAQKRIRFGRFVDIINAHVVGSVGTVIATEPFNRLFSAKAKAHCGGAYGLAAIASFVEAGRIARALDELRPVGGRIICTPIGRIGRGPDGSVDEDGCLRLIR